MKLRHAAALVLVVYFLLPPNRRFKPSAFATQRHSAKGSRKQYSARLPKIITGVIFDRRTSASGIRWAAQAEIILRICSQPPHQRSGINCRSRSNPQIIPQYPQSTQFRKFHPGFFPWLLGGVSKFRSQFSEFPGKFSWRGRISQSRIFPEMVKHKSPVGAESVAAPEARLGTKRPRPIVRQLPALKTSTILSAFCWRVHGGGV
jgi:hypothetical protein